VFVNTVKYVYRIWHFCDYCSEILLPINNHLIGIQLSNRKKLESNILILN